MDQKTKEAYKVQYQCIDEIKALVTVAKARSGREYFSHIESFG